jgi:hypothetical protein
MDGKMFDLNKTKCEVLLKAVQSLKFKFSTDPEVVEEAVYAYVYPTDKAHTVYLCPYFFAKNDEKPLSQDSKIGTLIHEVSHFKDVLGTDDLGKDEYIAYLKKRKSDESEWYNPLQYLYSADIRSS